MFTARIKIHNTKPVYENHLTPFQVTDTADCYYQFNMLVEQTICIFLNPLNVASIYLIQYRKLKSILNWYGDVYFLMTVSAKFV